MKFNAFTDAFDDAQHSLDERAAIAARSTWSASASTWC
jgi:hypothetical protein